MRPGLPTYVPESPWQNIHENFTNSYTGSSWAPDHSDDSGLGDGDLYKRATANLQGL